MSEVLNNNNNNKKLLHWALFSQAEQWNYHIFTLFVILTVVNSVSVNKGYTLQSIQRKAYRLHPTIWLLIKYLTISWGTFILDGILFHSWELWLWNCQEVIKNVYKGMSINALLHLSRNGKINVNWTQSVTLVIHQVSILQQTHDPTWVYISLNVHRPQHQEHCFCHVLIFPYAIHTVLYFCPVISLRFFFFFEMPISKYFETRLRKKGRGIKD